MYVVLYSQCEEIGQGFFMWKNDFEECKKHPQHFFLKRHFKGFVVSAKAKLPDGVRKLEENDIIEVKEQSNEGKRMLKDALKRQGEFDLEKIEEEMIL